MGETTYEGTALWFAEGIGPVRMEQQIINYGNVHDSAEYGLVSYQLP